ncbi:MAG TPA: hypothetical protein VN042_04660 [Asticcacaulis sp.]|nr:hypothetical protein [Asticcacaulis sp.]
MSASVLLHILLFTAFAISSSTTAERETKGDGQADVEGFQLDLVGVHHPSNPAASQIQTQEQAAQQSAMQAFQQMANQASPSDAKPSDYSLSKSQPKSLAQVFGADPFQPSSPADASEAAKTRKASHVEVKNSNSATMNDLWKAIEPCWRRVADRSTESVTLQVSFSPLGNLAKPPTILRAPGTHVDDRLLRSENQAITALAQCGPYLMAYGQQDVRVMFPRI